MSRPKIVVGCRVSGDQSSESSRFGRRLDQRELGQRGAQVEAGAADDDRPPARLQRRVDLAMGQRHVVADRERLGDRHEADQPVLEPRPLRSAGGPGQPPEPLVDLQRVAGDRHRVLAALPQQLGESDRDPGLADPGRAEDRRRRSKETAQSGFTATPSSVCEVRRVDLDLDELARLGDPFEVDRLVVAGAAAQPASRRCGWCPRPAPPSRGRRSAGPARRRGAGPASTSRSMRSTLTGCGTWSSIVAASVSRRGEKTKVKAPS